MQPAGRSSRRLRSGVAALAVAALVVLAAVWSIQAVRRAERSTGNDLVGYLAASEALYSGGDPYRVEDRFPYIYPLFLATVLFPLTRVDVRAASLVWFALQGFCLWLVLRTAFARTGHDWFRSLVLSLLVVAVFADVLQSEFVNGQVNLLVVALTVAAIGRGESRPHLAAALLGAAIALKLTPALVLVFLAVQGRWRTALEAIGWTALLVTLPWLAIGSQVWVLYGRYVDDFLLPRIGAAVGEQGIFFTVPGLWRWLTGALPPLAVSATSALVVVLLVAAWHRRLLVAGGSDDHAHVGWVYVAVILLLSPMSEVHHLTYLLPSFSLVALVASTRDGDFERYAVLAFAVLLWIARFDRRGAWYFMAVTVLILVTGVTIHRGAFGVRVPVGRPPLK